MEHERRCDKGTLAETQVSACIQHTVDVLSKEVESYIFVRVPLMDGSKHFYRLSRRTYCETEGQRETEMNSCEPWFQREVKNLFLNLRKIETDIVQYDDEAHAYSVVGRNEKFVKKNKMYWPPVARIDEKSQVSYLDFCEE